MIYDLCRMDFVLRVLRYGLSHVVLIFIVGLCFVCSSCKITFVIKRLTFKIKGGFVILNNTFI